MGAELMNCPKCGDECVRCVSGGIEVVKEASPATFDMVPPTYGPWECLSCNWIEQIAEQRDWRRYAALEIVRQAVVDIHRGGDITGVTCEKMKRLFPEIKTGYEALP